MPVKPSESQQESEIQPGGATGEAGGAGGDHRRWGGGNKHRLPPDRDGLARRGARREERAHVRHHLPLGGSGRTAQAHGKSNQGKQAQRRSLSSGAEGDWPRSPFGGGRKPQAGLLARPHGG